MVSLWRHEGTLGKNPYFTAAGRSYCKSFKQMSPIWWFPWIKRKFGKVHLANNHATSISLSVLQREDISNLYVFIDLSIRKIFRKFRMILFYDNWLCVGVLLSHLSCFYFSSVIAIFTLAFLLESRFRALICNRGQIKFFPKARTNFLTKLVDSRAQIDLLSSRFQRRIYDPVKHLWWGFLTNIANGF